MRTLWKIDVLPREMQNHTNICIDQVPVDSLKHKAGSILFLFFFIYFSLYFSEVG